ncbi:MAG: tetratricopeptide repeat protein [Opitutales bacterium]
MAVTADELQSLIDDATFDFTLGEADQAVAKLHRATAAAPESFAAWHALAEIQFSRRQLDEALQAAERAHALNPQDLFINTTLSRIWMERGDKATAEKFGAQAKILGWKDQLENPQGQVGGIN